MHRFGVTGRVQIAVALLAGLVCGCDRLDSQRLIGVDDEKQAIQIVALIEQITGETNVTVASHKGADGVEWEIRVPAKLAQQSRAILTTYGLPRKSTQTETQSGWFPSPNEERLRAQAELARSIESMLLTIDGVVAVTATVNLPDPAPLHMAQRSEPSASVVVRHLAETKTADGGQPISLPDAQRLVASCVRDLNPERVVMQFSSTTMQVAVATGTVGKHGQAELVASGVAGMASFNRVPTPIVIVTFVLIAALFGCAFAIFRYRVLLGNARAVARVDVAL